MQDSDQHPILESMSDFYVADIYTSDLSFFQILKSMADFHMLKSTYNDITDICTNPNPNQ